MAPLALNTANLDRLPIAKPAYDRTILRGGIVHLGLGGFHRAHMARYTHDLLQIDSDATRWSIIGVGLIPGDASLLAALRQQDHLYTLVERDADGSVATIIGALAGVENLTDTANGILHRI